MDPTLGAAVIGTAGSLAAGQSSAKAQASANQKNLQWSKYQFHKQNKRADSAYQRSTADMKKAGINPMLAYMQGGADTGASLSAGGQVAEDPNLQGAVSSAMEGARLSQDLKIQKATEQKIKQDTVKAKTETTLLKAGEPKAEMENQLTRKAIKYIEQSENSAKKAGSNIKSWFKHLKGSSAKDFHTTGYKTNKAVRKAKSNYKQSQASKDAQKARSKKSKQHGQYR